MNPTLQPKKDRWDDFIRSGLGFSHSPLVLYSFTVWGPCFFPHLARKKKVWEIQVTATLLLSEALNICKFVFVNVFKQRKLPLVQSETSASLTNSKHMEPFEYCIVCLWGITGFTAFFINIIPSIQAESICAGSIGSTFCTFCFVPYRLKENVGFAYESMGLLRLKKPRIIMYKHKYCMWSKCYGSHLWWNMYVFPRVRPS